MTLKKYHIGITGPIHIPSLNIKYTGDRSKWPIGMGGTPVNHLINSLLELNFKVSVFSSSPEIEEGNSFEWHEENLSIYIGPYRNNIRNRCTDFFSVERLYIKKAIIRANPHLVHAHWQYEWAYASLESGIPTLVTCHDSPYHVLKAQTDLYRLFRLIMAFIVIKRAKYLTTVSDYCAKGLRLMTSRKIDVIPNFESDIVFNYYKSNRILSQKQINVVMINNGFTRLKNVSVGIKAFQKFRVFYPNAVLHLFGKSFAVDEQAYQWCLNEKVSKNVCFHGELQFDDLMEKLSNMDVLLHTSLEESFGMVLVEAMAMGIPVVAGKDSGGPEWILKEGGGLLVNVKSPDEVSKGLLQIVESEVYTSLSKIAREVAEARFSKKTVVSQYIEKYRLIVKIKP